MAYEFLLEATDLCVVVCSIAVNSALLGTSNAIASNSTNGNGTSPQIQMDQKRGRALATIVCAGGFTNVGAVLIKRFRISRKLNCCRGGKDNDRDGDSSCIQCRAHWDRHDIGAIY